MNKTPDYPSILKFQQHVQLKDYRPKTKKEYVRYVRRLADHVQCDPATLAENDLRAYFIHLREHRRWGRSPMHLAKCSLRCFYQECLGVTGWTVFGELRIAQPQVTPSEHSSGGSRTQGGITKCGNAHCRRVLTEAAWQYRLAPKVSEAVQKRQQGQSKEVRRIAWKAQQRLHKRFKLLAAKKKRVVAATGVARELAGFVWAIACQVKPSAKPAAPEVLRTCRGKVYRLDADKKLEKTR